MDRKPFTEKLMILGIDGMDPKITRRLMKEGRLPNIEQYVRRGSAREDLKQIGCLPTITPPCWTSLATGAYPGTHGITCYWRQSPESLDAVVYNMDSRFCRAEQLWNVTAETGRKTLVWHWPGSSWPPSSDSPALSVVDGTQPGSVNMGISQMDWEKIIYASPYTEKLQFTPRSEKQAGVGCNITDLQEIMKDRKSGDDEMMEIWWGDKSREGSEIRTYVDTLDDTEVMIGSKVGYDIIDAPIMTNGDSGPGFFSFPVSDAFVERTGILFRDDQGHYNRLQIYENPGHLDPDTLLQMADPVVELEEGQMKLGRPEEISKKGRSAPSVRHYKLLELDPESGDLRLWISNALDTTNDTLWHTKDLYRDITEHVGYVPPVSLIGGEEDDIVEEIFIPSWDHYNTWQADCINYLIDRRGYEVVFSHLHNVDCAGHQIWHLGKTLDPWDQTDETTYQGLIERMYEQTDDYLGRFLYRLDEGWTILIVSDHGLIVGENVPPLLGEYGGLNIPVMEKLGYTVMKRDADGNRLLEVDWSRTRAVQIRSNYIYVNLAGRDRYGIVPPEEKYALEEQIISDLYAYRDENGERIVGLAVRNHDGVLLGVSGPECGDIYFSIRENHARLHGDSLTTAEGYFATSVAPVFIAAGKGILPDHTTDRVIRQVDIAPTCAALLGVRFPAQCEGAPIYQILDGEL